MNLRKTTALFLFVFLFPASLFSQSNDQLRKEAMEFSLSVFESIFSKNCKTLFNKFSPNLYFLESENHVTYEDEFEESICEEVEEIARDHGEKTFEDYKKEHEKELYTKDEFFKKYKETYFKFELKGFEVLDTDFIFLGTNNINTDFYIWFEMELLLIRKIEGKWWVVGMLI